MASDMDQRVRLHRAAFMGRDGRIQSMLESGSVNVDSRLPDGETALHAAVIGGNISTVLLLLECDANPNIQNKLGETPLHYAAMNAMDEIVSALLSKGADFTIMTKAGQFPVDLAGTDLTHHMLTQKEIATEQSYEELVQLFLQKHHWLLVGLSNNLALDENFTRSEREVISHSILHLFDWKNQALGLIKWAIYHEVGATIHESTLFRSDSFATRLMSGFTKLFGKEYLRAALGDSIRAIINDSDNLEIDPEKCGDEKVDENLQKLLTFVKKFLDGILTSLRDCPMSIRRICSFLRQAVGLRFPKSKYVAVGGFLFLRFFSSGIMTPDYHGVVDGPPPGRARRGLVLVAKIIQNLSNEVLFGEKEAFMIACNPFLEANQTHFRNFLDQVSTVPKDGSYTSAIPTWRFSVCRALFHIHWHLAENVRGIAAQIGIEHKVIDEKVRHLEAFTHVSVAAMPRQRDLGEKLAEQDRSASPTNEVAEEGKDADKDATYSSGLVDAEIARSRNFQRQKDQVKDQIRSVLLSLQKLRMQIERAHTLEEVTAAARLVRSIRQVLETRAEDLRQLNLPAMRVTRPEFTEGSILMGLEEQKTEALRRAALGLFEPFHAHFTKLLETLASADLLEMVGNLRGRAQILKQLMSHYWGIERGGAETLAANDSVQREMGRRTTVTQDLLRSLRDELEASNSPEMAISIATLLRNAKRVLDAPAGESFRMAQYEVQRPLQPKELPKGNVAMEKKLAALRQMCDMLFRALTEILDKVLSAIEMDSIGPAERRTVARSAVICDLVEQFLNPPEMRQAREADSKNEMKIIADREFLFSRLIKLLSDMGVPRKVDVQITKAQSHG